MEFESRGLNTIIAEYDRVEHIKLRFKACLSDFILNYIGNVEFKYCYKGDSEYLKTLNEEGLEEYHNIYIGEFIKLFSAMQKEFLALQTLDDMYSYLSYDNTFEALNNDNESGSSIYYAEKYLQFGTSRGDDYILPLNNLFNNKFKWVIRDEIYENLKDMEDVKLGNPIKSIKMKKHKREMELKKEQEDKISIMEDARLALDELYELGAFDDE